MKCPRRTELGDTSAFNYGDEDEWKDNHCSWCGSLHPDEFMRRIQEGDVVTPTDKNYKAYLEAPWAKFYFPHLSEDQRHEFVDLLNAKKINLGYPGYFYRLPFFVIHPEG